MLQRGWIKFFFDEGGRIRFLAKNVKFFAEIKYTVYKYSFQALEVKPLE